MGKPTVPEQVAPEPAQPGKPFRNISPLGALELPLLGRVIKADEVFVVDDERAEHLRGQEAVWQPVGWQWPEPPTDDPTDPEGGQDEPQGGELA